MKLKLLTGAVVLAMSGVANAAIDNGIDGNGELFFSIWDSTNGTSYTADLDMTLVDFVATPSYSSTSLNGLNTYISDAQSNGGTLQWNVGAMSDFDNSFSNLSNYGVLTTSNDGFAAAVAQNQQGPVEQSLIAGRGYVNAVNSADTDNDGVVTAIDGDPAYAGGVLIFNSNWAGQMGALNTSAGVDETLDFYQFNFDFDGTNFNPITNEFASAGVWSLDASTGEIEFASSTPDPIPLPPAVWLLGSAMVGLVGVARRRKASA